MSEEVIRYGAGGVPYVKKTEAPKEEVKDCLLYTSPSPRD